MESGPVVAAMLLTYYPHGSSNLEEWGWVHNSPEDYYPYPGPVQSINHQVVIVGWNDDSAIANGGYWIVKNSFGEEWGYDGFFNLEYGSLNIDQTEIDWVEYDPGNYSNWMPVAQINGSAQGQTNQQMTFNGNGSFDHEGAIVSYEWNLGDGTIKTGPIVTHAYTQAGIYLVTLTVTDNATNIDNQTMWVSINTENHPPKTPSIRGRRTGENGTAYTYTFTATDPDADDIYYYLNWGDTYWAGGSVGWIGPYKSGQKVVLEKTWEKKGNYTIRIKAKDRYDAKSDWGTLQVTMPYSYAMPVQRFLHNMLERFPYAFPLLHHVFGY
jgi:hypothetical protein